jgi:hypothetical protein
MYMGDHHRGGDVDGVGARRARDIAIVLRPQRQLRRKLGDPRQLDQLHRSPARRRHGRRAGRSLAVPGGGGCSTEGSSRERRRRDATDL